MSEVLRIGTWNVEYADNAGTNARRQEVMHHCPADIWILTETHDDLTPGGDYVAVHSFQRPLHGRRVKQQSRWVSIWSRHPIVTRICLPCADLERTVVALIAAPLGPLLVYGTVMPWHDDKGRMGERKFAANWSEHHRVAPQQAREWEALYSLLPDAALIVAGDYNTDMDSGALYGTKRGIEIVREGFDRCGLYCATQALASISGLALPPIDHIAVPKVWKKRVSLAYAWEGKVGSPRLSDHSGIVISVPI